MTIDNDQVVYSQRLALQVERYHTWPKVTRQSVGEHSAQVMRIYCRLFGTPRAQVWLHILEHDLPEMRFGDLPFSGDFAPELTVAKHVVELRVRNRMGLGQHEPLSLEEGGRVKLCDMMDCFEWGVHEERLGNQYGKVVASNVTGPILVLARKLDVDERVRTHMTMVELRP